MRMPQKKDILYTLESGVGAGPLGARSALRLRRAAARGDVKIKNASKKYKSLETVSVFLKQKGQKH